MGFLKRLLGIERRPGEPEPLGDERFDEAVSGDGLPVFVLFSSLWCPQCQVMHGLLNELGPLYAGRALFYRMDVSKSPNAPARLEVRGVPQVIAFRGGAQIARLTGLIPIDELREWIENRIGGTEEGS